MASSKKSKPCIFLLFTQQGEYKGSYKNLGDAIKSAEKEEMDGSVILKVVEAWEGSYPPEPDLEFDSISLESLDF